MDQVEKLISAFRKAGLRVTRQRRAVARALAASDDHPDATELHLRAREIDPSVSLATVYRALGALEEKGAAQRHAFEGSSARFECADTPHHDHIIDVDSGEVHEFLSPEIERLQQEVARKLGYEVVSHRLVLHCRRRGEGDRRA